MISEVESNGCVCGQLTCSLLDLVAAVGSGVADDELQLLTGVVHKLSLKGSLLGPGGPGEPLIDVEEPVQTHRQGNQTPTHCLPDLHTATKLQVWSKSKRTAAEIRCSSVKTAVVLVCRSCWRVMP